MTLWLKVAGVVVSTETKEGQAAVCLRAKVVEMQIVLQEVAVVVRVKRTTHGPCAIPAPDHTPAVIQEHYSQDTVPKEKCKDITFWPNKTPIGPEKELEETKYFTVKSFFKSR